MDNIKKMSIKEFRESGLLQEVNRLFLHPIGLAMETVIENDGTEHFGEIWDYRDDPEGIIFGDGMISEEKINKVQDMFDSKVNTRNEILGYHIQPAG